MTGYILQESKLTTIEKSVPDEPRVHCLICQGEGNQFYSICDLSDTSLVWTQDIYEVEGGFKDANGILIIHGDARYAALQNDYQWKVETYEKLQLAAGDFVTLKPTKGETEYLSIAEMEIDAKNLITLRLSASDPKFLDIWEVIQGFSKGYTDRYIQNAREAISQTTTFTPPTAATLTFEVPSDALLSSHNPRITLSLQISVATGTAWVISHVYTTTVPDKVTNDGYSYICIANHTSDAAKEPGVGASWATYWTLDPGIVGRVVTRIMKGTDYAQFGQFPPTTIGGLEYPEIDITDLCIVGSNVFQIYVVPDSETLPLLTVSASMNFYKRSEIK